MLYGHLPNYQLFIATSHLMFQGTSRYCMPSVLTTHFYSTSHIKLYSLEPNIKRLRYL